MAITVSLPTPLRERSVLRPVTTPPPPSVGKRLFAEVMSATREIGFKRFAWSAVNTVLPPFTMRIVRTKMLRWIGAEVQDRVGVVGAITLLGMRGCARRLHIGSGTIIAHGAVFGLDATIRLGENVSVGPFAVLHTGTHALGPSSCRMSRKTVAKPIVVENGVWIGMGAMILPGVRLGRGCVVSAGAVVKDDVPADTIVAGNPAVVVGHLPKGDR